jgi:hypothetical protein
VATDEEVFVADAVNRRAVTRLDVRHAAGDDADLARRQAFAVNVQGIEVVAVQRLQVAAVGAIATVGDDVTVAVVTATGIVIAVIAAVGVAVRIGRQAVFVFVITTTGGE